MTAIAIIQARMGSSRLPGKVLHEISGVPLIGLLIERLKKAKMVDDIVVATTDQLIDDQLAAYLADIGVKSFRGSEQDVLSRYYDAAKLFDATTIIRITGDCPMVDPAVVDHCLEKYSNAKVDYLSNTLEPSYPDGFDVEVFSFSALEKAANEAKDDYYREHVTPYFYRSGLFPTLNVSHFTDLSDLRLTVDEPEDLELASSVFEYFSPNRHFNLADIVALVDSSPEMFNVNNNIARNEGANMGNGQKLWRRAKRIIPGGNMLLSKRSEMFLPDHWPSYFETAKGCIVTDLDGNSYRDMSFMGIGTNTLGYGHPEVDAAVLDVVGKGNLSTLNCPEEVYLAERLIALDPWAEMVRFARSGGEANAIAVRIARAASGRDNVAVCGYHGWHDWYLSANLGDENNLAGHLLPGLNPAGVPKSLKSCVFPFNYNDFDSLADLVENQSIGVIKMEVMRNAEPADGFLQKIRKLADDNGIVLVFDECTSGFRETFGGLYKKYGVEPDMAVYGKTLGNGYGITATVGRRSVMDAAQSTFISSTFWTERIGSAAALKSLEIMEREKSWEKITQTGYYIVGELKKMADRHGLSISLGGLPSIVSYSFDSENALAYKTLITQEMLKKRFLASTAIYSSMAHTAEIIEEYFAELDPIYALIAECEQGREIASLLDGPICHSGFKRLN